LGADKLAPTAPPHDLCTILWSFATSSHPALELFDAISLPQNARRIVDSADPAHLTMLVWAYAKSKHRGREVFEAVERRIGRVCEEGTNKDLGIVVWSFAMNGHDSDAVFRAVALQGEKIVKGANFKSMTWIVWAYAIAGKLKDPASAALTTALWSRVLRHFGAAKKDDLYMLNQFYAIASVEAPLLELARLPAGGKISEAVVSELEDKRDKKEKGGSFDDTLIGKISDHLRLAGFEHDLKVNSLRASETVRTPRRGQKHVK